MALRAFRSNPSLGGFGGESSGAPPAEAHPSVSGPRRGSPLALPTELAAGGGSRALASGGTGRPDGGERCAGDAFAQIVKELVDNAVDACSGGGAAAEATEAETDEGAIVLKRVRVVIEPVNREDGHGNDNENDERGERDLRISVNDNGSGMESIERCVEAFRTSKRNDDCGEGGGAARARLSQSRQDDEVNDGGEDSSKKDGSRNEDNCENNGKEQRKGASNAIGEQSLTAGRYGIGLTLCLLHSQRLCPKSVASITSATAASPHWTRASYVVDAEGDRVECVKKELLSKKRAEESGTMVSLLVPGGEGAQRVWPRLAEYFARFQLSLGVKCSLEVKAPTLSSVPLYIRPPFEVKRHDVREEGRRVVPKKSTTKEASGDVVSASVEESSRRRDLDEKWNDGMLSSDDENDVDGSSVDENSSKVTDRSGSDRDDDDNAEPSPIEVGQDPEESRRQSILKAVSSYLNRPVELKNVAHSVEPIRRYGRTDNASSSRPMLEVDMIVYGPDDDSRSDEGERGDADSDNNSNGDEFENMFMSRESTAPNGSVANLMLIRMVNHIPILDGSEALGCGLVRGIATKDSTWNSFGLDVSPATESSTPALYSDTPMPRTPPDYTPMYSIRDSAQVAPFFRSSTHSLFESDNDSDDGGGSEEEADISDDEDNHPRDKRKRRARARLLPAGVRLGNVLIIAQIHAKPSALPLPTLSKGRLPINDAGIDDALTITLTSCLRSLQRTNPELLLTAYQLKRTERDVRYIPAVATSLASIIKKSLNDRFQVDMMGKITSWEKENQEARSMPQSVPETIPMQNVGPSNDDAVDTRVSREQENGSTQTTASCHEGNTALEPSQQLGLLSVSKLGRLIEDQLRFCISDQNKARRKQEERERKREARRRANSEGDDDAEEEEDKNDSDEESGSKFKSGDGSVDMDGILECSDEEGTAASPCGDRVRRCSQVSSLLSVDKSTSNCGSQQSTLSDGGRMGSEDEWSEQQSPPPNENPRRKNDAGDGGNSGIQEVDQNEDDFDDDGWW